MKPLVRQTVAHWTVQPGYHSLLLDDLFGQVSINKIGFTIIYTTETVQKFVSLVFLTVCQESLPEQ